MTEKYLKYIQVKEEANKLNAKAEKILSQIINSIGDDSDLLTTDEVARELRVSRSTISRMLDDGQLEYTRVRTRRMVLKSSLPTKMSKI